MDFCTCLRGTGSLKDAIKKVDCGWKKVFVKIYTQGGFPQATRHQCINSFFPPPFSPPIPPTFNFSIIYSSEIPHIPPPLAIRDNLMRATSSLEIFLSFNGFELRIKVVQGGLVGTCDLPGLGASLGCWSQKQTQPKDTQRVGGAGLDGEASA